MEELTIRIYYPGAGDSFFDETYEDQRYFVNITDITDFIKSKGGQYGGKWKLEVISDKDALLEDFRIDITKYLNPNNPDTDGDTILDGVELNPELNNGWITNPANHNSDGDTVRDDVEITNGWNPLSADTDGDGVPDWRDADPKRNLIVKVQVNSGHFDNILQIFTPLLQVTLEVVADASHKYEVATPSEWASTGPKNIDAWVPWVCSYTIRVCLPWWLGGGCFNLPVFYPCLKKVTLYTIQTTSIFNDAYYFDVDDGNRYLDVNAKLWKWYLLGWAPEVSGAIRHNFMDASGDRNFQDNVKIQQGGNYIEMDIETIGVERVNTIAVHEEGSFYNGHYSSIERMAVIMLDVQNNDDMNFNQFVQGVNVILIPTSVFMKSKLHSIIETSVAHTEPIYHSDPQNYMSKSTTDDGFNPYYPNLHFDAAQWSTFQFRNKVGAYSM